MPLLAQQQPPVAEPELLDVVVEEVDQQLVTRRCRGYDYVAAALGFACPITGKFSIYDPYILRSSPNARTVGYARAESKPLGSTTL